MKPKSQTLSPKPLHEDKALPKAAKGSAENPQPSTPNPQPWQTQNRKPLQEDKRIEVQRDEQLTPKLKP